MVETEINSLLDVLLDANAGDMVKLHVKMIERLSIQDIEMLHSLANEFVNATVFARMKVRKEMKAKGLNPYA